MQIRTQEYAREAIVKVKDVLEHPHQKEYGQLALQFPVMVLQSGLAQASGFVLAKNRDGQLHYLNDLAQVLGEGNAKSLHNEIIHSKLSNYQNLTRKVLDAAGWFKRYAQGILKAENEG